MSALSLSHLKCIYLADVTLSSGGYAAIMAIIHIIVVFKQPKIFSKPDISFSTLQRDESGDPRTFQGDEMWISDSAERRNAFSGNLEESQHPTILKQVEELINNGDTDRLNPLLGSRSP